MTSSLTNEERFEKEKLQRFVALTRSKLYIRYMFDLPTFGFESFTVLLIGAEGPINGPVESCFKFTGQYSTGDTFSGLTGAFRFVTGTPQSGEELESHYKKILARAKKFEHLRAYAGVQEFCALAAFPKDTYRLHSNESSLVQFSHGVLAQHVSNHLQKLKWLGKQEGFRETGETRLYEVLARRFGNFVADVRHADVGRMVGVPNT